MNEADRKARNEAMLAQCNRVAAARFRLLLSFIEHEGHRPRINEGDAWRSPAEQAAAVASGHSTVPWGMHNATTPDGKPDSLAIDLVDDDSPLVPRARFLQRVNEVAPRFGLLTGILWSKKAHPLTEVEKARIWNAVATGDWSEVHRIGFDPLHVQVAGLTIDEAKAGRRPV